MKPVELVAVGVRFFAMNLVLWGFTLMFSIVDVTRRYSPYVGDQPSALPILILGGASVLLLLSLSFLFWRFPMPIARYIVPKGIEGEFRVSFSAEQLEVLLLSLVGVWVLIEAIPQIGQLAVWVARVRLANEDVMPALEPLALRVLQIAFGVLLVFRSAGIRRIISDLRTKGT